MSNFYENLPDYEYKAMKIGASLLYERLLKELFAGIDFDDLPPMQKQRLERVALEIFRETKKVGIEKKEEKFFLVKKKVQNGFVFDEQLNGYCSIDKCSQDEVPWKVVKA